MAITMAQAADKFRNMWENLKHIFPWDSKYNEIKPELLGFIVDQIKQAKIVFPDGTEIAFGSLGNEGDLWDCDDFASGAEFLAKLYYKHLIQSKDIENLQKERMPVLPMAFGQVRVSRFRGITGFHALDHCITTDGIYFIDFDDGGRRWRASQEKDEPFYVSI